MPNKPKASVAVITRTKNRPILLRRAIESIANQTYKDLILVIVNDGGTKKPVDDLVKKYSKQLKDRVKVIHNPKSLGMEGASNKGIKSVDSKYVIIHDDDDALHPDFLKETVAYLEENPNNIPDLGGVVTYMELIYEKIEGEKVTEVSREGCRNWIPELTLSQMAAGNLFAPISFLYKREAYKKTGGMYRTDLPVLGDWEFNLRFMLQYNIGLIPKEMAYYYHRVPNTNNNYSNTVVDGVNKHVLYNQLLRNELLREDIKQNRVGLGYLINQAPGTNKLYEQMDQTHKLLLDTRNTLQHTHEIVEHTQGKVEVVSGPVLRMFDYLTFWKRKNKRA